MREDDKRTSAGNSALPCMHEARRRRPHVPLLGGCENRLQRVLPPARVPSCPPSLPPFRPFRRCPPPRRSDKILQQQHGSPPSPPALARADPDYSAQRGSHGPFKQLREGCVTGSMEERTFDVQVDEVSIEIAALR